MSNMRIKKTRIMIDNAKMKSARGARIKSISMVAKIIRNDVGYFDKRAERRIFIWECIIRSLYTFKTIFLSLKAA